MSLRTKSLLRVEPPNLPMLTLRIGRTASLPSFNLNNTNTNDAYHNNRYNANANANDYDNDNDMDNDNSNNSNTRMIPTLTLTAKRLSKEGALNIGQHEGLNM